MHPLFCFLFRLWRPGASALLLFLFLFRFWRLEASAPLLSRFNLLLEAGSLRFISLMEAGSLRSITFNPSNFLSV